MEKIQRNLRDGVFFDFQKFLDSIVHVLDTLHLWQTQTPAVTDVKDSSIGSGRFRVLAVNATRLKDKRDLLIFLRGNDVSDQWI